MHAAPHFPLPLTHLGRLLGAGGDVVDEGPLAVLVLWVKRLTGHLGNGGERTQLIPIPAGAKHTARHNSADADDPPAHNRPPPFTPPPTGVPQFQNSKVR